MPIGFKVRLTATDLTSPSETGRTLAETVALTGPFYFAYYK